MTFFPAAGGGFGLGGASILALGSGVFRFRALGFGALGLWALKFRLWGLGLWGFEV